MTALSPRHAQAGAALAIALLLLVVITLLGVAAVRATQTELKLSQNAESRMTAVQAADSMVAFVSTSENMPVNGNVNFLACVLPTNIAPASLSCGGGQPIDVRTATPSLQANGYALVRREPPLFVEVTVLREAELSAKNYDFARFTVTGGFNRASESKSAAEIIEGTLKLHTKVAGVTYE